MKAEWENIQFDFPETYKDTDTYILKGTEEIVGLLDEHIMTTQGLQFSIYKKPLEKEIDEWATLIMTVCAIASHPRKVLCISRGGQSSTIYLLWYLFFISGIRNP